MQHEQFSETSFFLDAAPIIDTEAQYRLRSMAEHMESFFRCMPAIKAIHIIANETAVEVHVDGVLAQEQRVTMINSVKVAARSSGCLKAVSGSNNLSTQTYKIRSPELGLVLSRTFTANNVWKSMRAAFLKS
jgi:hypothetical protein